MLVLISISQPIWFTKRHESKKPTKAQINNDCKQMCVVLFRPYLLWDGWPNRNEFIMKTSTSKNPR